MKKYRVKVEITKEYEIEIDDTKITEEDLDDFEKVFYDLDEEDDRYKSMAGDYCRLRAEQGQGFIEGYGYVLENGIVPYSAKIQKIECNDAINLTSIEEDEEPFVTVDGI